MVSKLPKHGRYEKLLTIAIFLYYYGAAFLNYNFSFMLLFQPPDTEKPLSNWIHKLGLENADGYQIGLFGTLSFTGEVISCFVFPALSDKIGRRYFTIVGAIVQLTVYILMLTFSSYTLFLCLMPFFGMTCCIRYCISYSHLMELQPASKSAYYSGFLFFTDGLVCILSPLILLVVKHTDILIVIGIALDVAVLVLIWVNRPQEAVKLLLS